MPSNGERTDDTAQRSDNETTTSGPISRRRIIQSGGVLGGAALAGCLSGGGDDDGGSDTTNIAIVSSPAGFDDQAFNTLAVNGLEAAAEEYDIEIQQVERTSASQYPSTQADLAASSNPDYDLIVLVAAQHLSGLQTNAVEYPDQNWMLINDHVEEPNVAGRTWANHEMSYLAGVAAGTMTSRDFSYEGSSTASGSLQIGFVGGSEIPLIRAFEEAYVAGAQWVNSDVEVSTGYIGNFSDTGVANDIATSQYQNGADIVYHAASAAGEGVFPAAQDANRFAIGVDADQSVTLPEYQDVIMGSAVKEINAGTQNIAAAVAQDNWDSVSGGRTLGLEEEAVAFVPGQAIGPELPDVVSTNLEDARQAILNGDVTVPCSASGC